MTEQEATAVPEGTGSPAPRPDATAEQPSSTGLLLALATLIWMAAMLWSARATITGREDAEMEVTSTAYALPGAISAALVTGAATGLAVLTLLARRRALGATTRFAIATGTGLLVGLVGALTIVTINTEGWLYAVVGGTIAAAATIGGALAGFRAPRIINAVGWGSVAVFLVGFVLNLFQSPLLSTLGSGDTQSSQANAAQWFSYGQSFLSGLAAGLVAYRLLRRARARSGELDVPWGLYSLAGAGPGVLLVIAEILTRTAGSRVLELAGKVSELELVVQQMLSGARFNSALVVLFVGALTAMFAVGRTIRPAPDDEDDTPAPTPPVSRSGRVRRAAEADSTPATSRTDGTPLSSGTAESDGTRATSGTAESDSTRATSDTATSAGTPESDATGDRDSAAGLDREPEISWAPESDRASG
jgi:iron complex transport system permease protein